MMSSRLTTPAFIRPTENAPASAWAACISACWRASVEAILEVGRLLTAAKGDLPHGEFGAMCDKHLPFTASTAQRLMAIARDPKLSNAAHVQHLPPSWGTLYELTKLDDAGFKAGIENGSIRPDMDRRAVVKGTRSVMGSRHEPDGSLDYSPTPPFATRALIERVLPTMNISAVSLRSVHEPACGEGHMAEVLREYFPTVIATDIVDRGYGDAVRNFLDDTFEVDADWIITNPPFNKKAEQFTLKAIQQARVGVAIFARLQWIETIGRYERLFRDYPPTQIAFFCERVPLHMGRWEPEGKTATAYIWLVWVKARAPRPPFWIPPGQREACARPDDAERFIASPVVRKQHHIERALSTNTPAKERDDDGLDIPTFLRVGDPACTWRRRSS
jgi:hypothetical protein